MFYKSQKFERFETSYSFSCFLQQIYYLWFFKKFQGFFLGKSNFSCKKPNFGKFWEISLFCSHSTSNWLTVSVAFDIKMAKLSCLQNFRFLFRKNRLFLEPKMSRNPTDSFDSAAKLLPLSFQQKFKIVSREPHLFLRKTNFERFEKSYCFSRIQQRKWYF